MTLVHRAIFAVIVAVAAPAAHAAPAITRAQVCQTSLSGTWIISAYSFADVIAADPDEVKRSVGKTVTLSPARIDFAGTTCKVVRQEATITNDDLVYPLSIETTCQDGTIIPWLTVGTSCNRIHAELDGANYVLDRKS